MLTCTVPDGQHAVFTVRIGGLYRARFEKGQSPQRVLDVGCGTGIWTRRFAAAHPSSQVLGIDLNPAADINASENPPNCSFAKTDFEQDWSFSEKFDFIYMRMLMAAVKDWPALLEKAYSSLKPGGTIEVFEGFMEVNTEDGSTADSSAAVRWFELAKEYLSLHNIKWDLARNIPDQLGDAGFKLIEDFHVKMCLYPDEKDPEADRDWVAGQYVKDMYGVVHGMTIRMRNDMSHKLSSTEWDQLEHEAKRELTEEAKQRGFFTNL